MDRKLKSKKERNIDKKNVDRIVAAEQAKVKKRQMKERTGNPEVDKLMEEFESVKGYKFGENIGKKAMGGKVQTEYRGGGMVNLGNYKGQF
tara:strand:+ start:407 stop:679 length:273 start_codon:yes stop_codon:yes gene_type:complete